MPHIAHKTILIYAICAIFFNACSDFYAKDSIHIPSANHPIKNQKIKNERKVQAMRKSQILENNHTRVLMIAHYINEIDSSIVEKNKEIFLVELYSREDDVPMKSLSFSLDNGYKTIEAINISKIEPNEIKDFAPDIAYNDVYKVVFNSIGLMGRNNLKLHVEILNIGSMSFDFGFVKAKSNLTR